MAFLDMVKVRGFINEYPDKETIFDRLRSSRPENIYRHIMKVCERTVHSVCKLGYNEETLRILRLRLGEHLDNFVYERTLREYYLDIVEKEYGHEVYIVTATPGSLSKVEIKIRLNT